VKLTNCFDDWKGDPKGGYAGYKLWYVTDTITNIADGTVLTAKTAVDSWTTNEYLTTAAAIGDDTLATSHTAATAVNFQAGQRIRLGRAGIDISQCEDVTLATVAYTDSTNDTGAHTLTQELDRAHVITSTLLSPLDVYVAGKDFSGATYVRGYQFLVKWQHWGSLIATTYSDLLQEYDDEYEIASGVQQWPGIWETFGHLFANVRETCAGRETSVETAAKDHLRATFALYKRDIDRLVDKDITVRPMCYAMALAATEDDGGNFTEKRAEWMALFGEACQMLGKSDEWWDTDEDQIKENEEVAAPVSDHIFMRGF
jgi:hypothetical protein